jgi:hypothetical protein
MRLAARVAGGRQRDRRAESEHQHRQSDQPTQACRRRSHTEQPLATEAYVNLARAKRAQPASAGAA